MSLVQREFHVLTAGCFGTGLDILVNSGGVWTDAMMQDHMGPQAFNDAFNMHVITVTSLINSAMPHLVKCKVSRPLEDKLFRGN